jgi:glycosyltransferase involved in cell wall biosynthesis
MPTVGLSMIVKNEAHTLRPCLESVRGLVTQIVIGDTGSSDESCAIARDFGATVISVPWNNDFAAARNAALKPMRTDWVLVLDADEEFDCPAKDALPPLLEADDVTGYAITIRDYMPSKNSYFMERPAQPNDSPHERARSAPSYHDQRTIRLFRRNPEVFFIGCVHEMVEYRICLLGLKYVASALLIHHFGHLRGQQVRANKDRFYRELGHTKVQKEPDNPFAWFELGLLEYKGFGNARFGRSCFERVVSLHPPFTRAWLFLAMIQLESNQAAEALETIAQARLHGSADGKAALECLRGDAYRALGKLAAARNAYRRALAEGVSDPQVESALGLIEVRLGEVAGGLARLRKAVESAPDVADVHDRLLRAHFFAGNLEQAAEAAEAFAGCVIQPKAFVRAASIRAHLQQWEQTERVLVQGLTLFPASAELKTAYKEVAQLRVERSHV